MLIQQSGRTFVFAGIFIMESKICTKCKVDKNINEYYTSKLKKTGKTRIYSCCKLCSNAGSILSAKKHKEKANARVRRNYKLNPSAKRKDAKNHALKYPEQIKLRWKKWYAKNREKQILKAKKQYVENREKINIQRAKRNKEKWKTDTMFKLKVSLRNRISFIFRTNEINKKHSTEKLLGIRFEIAKQYIESKFKKGMNWENYGKWHIDHIIPLGSAKTEEDLILLCHYTNLQPLWALDNLSKNDTIPQVQMKLTL